MTFYDAHPFVDNRGKQRLYKKKISKFINFNSLKGKKILDVGCGTGSVSNIMHSCGANVYAIDKSETSIKIVKKNYPMIKAKVGDALDIKFKENTFDYVISLGVLHHTGNTYRGFKECVRVTKPGGKFLILLHCKYSPYEYIYHLSRLILKKEMPEKIHKVWFWIMKKLMEYYYKETVTYEQVRSMIADQFYTPINTFHSLKEIKQWAEANVCSLIGTSKEPFGHYAFYYIEKLK